MEQRRAVAKLSGSLGPRGYRVLLLGSVARLFRTRVGALTKDVDVHVSPSDDFESFYDDLCAVVKELRGTGPNLEPDGASATIWIPVDGRMVPIEIIEGREDFIQPEVLADALRTATEADGVLVPSWEHLVAMKAEAWYDRVGPSKTKFLDDLVVLHRQVRAMGVTLSRDEVRRIVGMRADRKRVPILIQIERLFHDVFG